MKNSDWIGKQCPSATFNTQQQSLTQFILQAPVLPTCGRHVTDSQQHLAVQ